MNWLDRDVLMACEWEEYCWGEELIYSIKTEAECQQWNQSSLIVCCYEQLIDYLIDCSCHDFCGIYLYILLWLSFEKAVTLIQKATSLSGIFPFIPSCPYCLFATFFLTLSLWCCRAGLCVCGAGGGYSEHRQHMWASGFNCGVHRPKCN